MRILSFNISFVCVCAWACAYMERGENATQKKFYNEKKCTHTHTNTHKNGNDNLIGETDRTNSTHIYRYLNTLEIYVYISRKGINRKRSVFLSFLYVIPHVVVVPLKSKICMVHCANGSECSGRVWMNGKVPVTHTKKKHNGSNQA